MTELELVADKLLSLEDLSRRRCGWRTYSQRTVFTNGVFDILHPGHVNYLQEAASQVDHLVIGLNSDASGNRSIESLL